MAMMKAIRIVLVTGLMAVAGCSPQPTALKGVGDKLVQLRKLPIPRAEDEFPPAFFEARDALRDWLDTRIATLEEKGNDFEFSTKLNQELKDAKLFCTQCDAATGGFSDASGYVGEVRFTRNGGLLQATTQVGVQCGFDENAYLYRWTDNKWQRVWDSVEKPRDGKYEPQTIDSIKVGDPTASEGVRRILTLAHFPGCKSAWQPVYYRLSSLDGKGPAQEPVVDERAVAPVPTRGAAISARLSGDDDLLVEYQTASLDPDVVSRMKIVHYRIVRTAEDKDKSEKIMPYALSPRDFIEEWLDADWPQAQAMIPGANMDAMAEQHQHLHSDHIHAEFAGNTAHCGTDYVQWQVHMVFKNSPAKPGEDRYFHLRWVPPYLFDLTGITDQPDATCGEGDPRVDVKRSLFYRR